MIPGFHSHSYELMGRVTSSKTYNPYSRHDLINQIGDAMAADEESTRTWSEISDFLTRSKYVEPKTVNPSKANELKTLSLNIRSLVKCKDFLAEEIEHFQNYDILCFNETNCNVEKLPNGINDLLLEGFHPPILQNPTRKTNKGGGLATYINKNVCGIDEYEKFVPKNMEELTSELDGEFMLVKLKRCKNIKKTMILCNTYRSPSRSPENFIDRLETLLQGLNRHKNKLILFTGDFNIDLLRYDNDINCQKLIEVMGSHGFIQTVSRPTRITDHSATLIDHVYINDIHSVTSNNNVTYDMSDHLGIVTSIILTGHIHDRCTTLLQSRERDLNAEHRIFNTQNSEKFRQNIENECWSAVDQEPCAQSKFNKFSEIYNIHYNDAFPLKSQSPRRTTERTPRKPWILPWLAEACERRKKFYFDFVKDPTPQNKSKYEHFKKFVDKHIAKAKNKYYATYFEQHKSNSRKQWQMINSLLNRNRKKVSITKLIDENGDIINTPLDIAENFNKFFSEIATKLKTETGTRTGPVGDRDYIKFLQPQIESSIYLRPVETEEINEIINKFENKTTSDTKISALKIANGSHSFQCVLANVISISFEQGLFPEQLKTAKVVPIHKDGSKFDVKNYRPISLLPTFSKIYEKTMHKRIYDFMDAKNILYDLQYGFRRGRSCEQALMKAQHTILDALNRKEIALLLLIDFSKAFDMVDHEILLEKLNRYGIRGNALEWMKSYLQNREQYVSISGRNSIKRQLSYGVPQGSILGPLLFIIYINDMPKVHKLAKFVLYADDANIILTGKNIEEIHQQVELLTKTLTDWVDCNGLKLNLKKTCFMIFSPHKTNIEYDLRMSNVNIERKSTARFLGVLINEKLNWAQHIAALRNKMARHIGVMYKLKGIIPLAARLNIFHSFVQSHVNYCSLIWGFSSRSNIESIFSAQKKGIRAVIPGFANYFYKDGQTPHHTKSAFTKYGVLSVQNIIAKNALIFMYKLHTQPQSLPPSIAEIFPADAPTYGSTHVTSSEWLKKYSSGGYNKSIFYKGPLLYVDFANNALCSTFPNTYKRMVKTLLLSAQSGGDPNEWQYTNHKLYSLAGLRRSKRNKLEHVYQDC